MQADEGERPDIYCPRTMGDDRRRHGGPFVLIPSLTVHTAAYSGRSGSYTHLEMKSTEQDKNAEAVLYTSKKKNNGRK